MRNVKSLSLSSRSLEVMYSSDTELPFFANLVKLSIESDTRNGWQVLPSLLNHSPNLETLALKGLHCVNKKGVHIGPSEVKVLEIYGFRGSVGEFSQSKCFLSQMKFLQVMKVEIDADDNKKLKLMSRLLALPRPSSQCQIHFS
ncbi:unnamed protein product [Microthlaspi erraticum]|uniref:FBD domain-containing protein n=1 Tax=Microthlaspi erraticum TaxID=1685480 RepID=A0A6D2I9N1_9BRAS|nr:unnamed protein product [Microthlaspi erraticum]